MPPKAKRIKKTKNVTIVTEGENEQGGDSNVNNSIETSIINTDISETEDPTIQPIVLKLPISNSRIEELIQENDITSNFKYNPNIVDPEPYIPDDRFISNHGLLVYQENEALTTTNNKDLPSELVSNTSTSFTKKLHHKLKCFWCCHSIINIEYGMPIRYDVIHKSFTTYGTFCSLECAAAYNYSINMGCDRAWEIHSWIQLIGKSYGLETPIRPAPSKYLLEMFGGELSIDEYRSCHKGLSESYVINIPPFIHITSQMECINTSFIDTDKISKTDGSRISGILKKKSSSQKTNVSFFNK